MHRLVLILDKKIKKCYNKHKKRGVIPMTNQKGMNRQYRDRLFKFIFGNPEHKEWTLSLYNAVNGTNYTNPEDIQLTTLDDAVYMNMKNDTSFLITETMNFWEQQSSFNPNMPMRILIYAGMIYAKYVEVTEDYHIYSSRQQKAPVPKCICFYNGKDNKEDKVILKLSDSFPEGSESDIEVKVTMINVNYGHNKDLMKDCKPLKEYSWFVDRVRFNQKAIGNLEKAVDATLAEMPDDFMIKPFLLNNQAEVKRMCITEYNEEKVFAQQREEGRAEGKAEGRQEGALEMLIGLVKDGMLSLNDAAKRVNMTVDEFKNKTGLKA